MLLSRDCADVYNPFDLRNSAFYRWGDSGSERTSDLPSIIELIPGVSCESLHDAHSRALFSSHAVPLSNYATPCFISWWGNNASSPEVGSGQDLLSSQDGVRTQKAVQSRQ